jgi:hypothetical protein
MAVSTAADPHYFYANPDQAFHLKRILIRSDSSFMRIRILPPKMIRIRTTDSNNILLIAGFPYPDPDPHGSALV